MTAGCLVCSEAAKSSKQHQQEGGMSVPEVRGNGRVALMNYGKEYGRLVVIVDVVDQNRALVDAPDMIREQTKLQETIPDRYQDRHSKNSQEKRSNFRHGSSRREE
ncbi:hypothetical protein HPP92_008555 [Vanilla planifolia]|uniref:Uncharacterized protein n=1 Tax=Vanilla planifolia TaxID=51239 RepID=A0A835R2P3_VANPL|nr:hypothetical protein HPP92_008555 [Vanilla planifolia]